MQQDCRMPSTIRRAAAGWPRCSSGRRRDSAIRHQRQIDRLVNPGVLSKTRCTSKHSGTMEKNGWHGGQHERLFGHAERGHGDGDGRPKQ